MSTGAKKLLHQKIESLQDEQVEKLLEKANELFPPASAFMASSQLRQPNWDRVFSNKLTVKEHPDTTGLSGMNGDDLLLPSEVKDMDSIKEKLRNTIDLLTEEEAKQVFDWLVEFARQNNISLTMRRLASDPTFKLPKDGFKGFKKVTPAQVQGTPASDLLSEDRG